MNIIQIGCNDGKDHVLTFVNANKNQIKQLILVDANQNCIDVCGILYRDMPKLTLIHNAVVTTNDAYADFFIPNNDETTNGHASTIESHLIRHNYSNFRKERMPAKNINVLLDELELPKIDRLYIDTEGLDVDIVDHINFDKFNIDYLMFEYIHSDGTLSWGGPKLNTCINRLLSLGYNISREEFNIIAQK